MSLPILYSLRQCPYAMRARMGLLLAEQSVLLRDIVMTNIPTEMLDISPKGSVPVLLLDDSTVIEESLDIMLWALDKNDPQNILYSHNSTTNKEILNLINRNDNEFVKSLNKYKAASRYHDDRIQEYRKSCEFFIEELEQRLTKHLYLVGETLSLADFAILPFIRQFSRVDRRYFLQSPYSYLRSWLKQHYENPLFSKVMKKYPHWLENKELIIFD